MWELTPRLDIQSDEPLYMQLYKYIKNEIKTGNIQPETKLPSKRKLARHLQISRNTIEAAYSQLAAEGYIESLARKGYYVSIVEQMPFEIKPNIQFVEEKKYIEENYAFDFTHSGVDPHSFPFELYRKFTNEVLRHDNEQILMLGHPQGELGLREEIANYLYESRGVHCSPSQIIIGAGTPFLLRLLCKILKGGIFAVEDPGYHRRLLELEHGKEFLRMIPLDQSGIILPSLEKSRANIAFVTPSHQFPCGMIMPISRRMQLLNWAEQGGDRFIIEDDYDSEFRYTGKPIPALQGLDTNEKVIYMSTFSKALLPSIRISYMVLPKPLIKKYHEEFFFFTQTVSRIDQAVLQRFLCEGHWEKHIQKMKVIYYKKRNALVSSISKIFPSSVEIIGQDSGLHLLVRPNNGMSEQELIERAAKSNVKVYPVSIFGTTDNLTVLLGFAILTEEEILEAVRLLAKAWFQ